MTERHRACLVCRLGHDAFCQNFTDAAQTCVAEGILPIINGHEFSVLRTQTTRTPFRAKRAATPSVSSPPQTTIASRPNLSMLATTSNDLSVHSPSALIVLKGLVRDEPRFVPPSRSQRRTFARSSAS